MKIPKGGSWVDIVTITLASAAGIAAYGFALQGRCVAKSNGVEAALFWLAGTLLVFPSLVDAIVKPLMGRGMPFPEPIGVIVLVAAIALQMARRRVTAPVA